MRFKTKEFHVDERVRTLAREIASACAAEYALDTDSFFGGGRWEPLATARQVAMFILHEDGKINLKRCGEAFGRHHPGGSHGWHNVRARITAGDLDIAERIARIRTKLTRVDEQRNGNGTGNGNGEVNVYDLSMFEIQLEGRLKQLPAGSQRWLAVKDVLQSLRASKLVLK